ncbi:MAG: hypothetical protein OXC26_05850 [Albidovulum sp.]|nr:hypothetical protein [Albidovulum sp.]
MEVFRLKAIENWRSRNVALENMVYSDFLPCLGAVATADCLHAPSTQAAARLPHMSRNSPS